MRMTTTPIACALTGAEYRERVDALSSLAATALRSREPRDAGERLTFDGSDETERALLDAIAAEASCCAFLRMDLRREGDRLVLDVTGPADARPIIAELFA